MARFSTAWGLLVQSIATTGLHGGTLLASATCTQLLCDLICLHICPKVPGCLRTFVVKLQGQVLVNLKDCCLRIQQLSCRLAPQGWGKLTPTTIVAGKHWRLINHQHLIGLPQKLRLSVSGFDFSCEDEMQVILEDVCNLWFQHWLHTLIAEGVWMPQLKINDFLEHSFCILPCSFPPLIMLRMVWIDVVINLSGGTPHKFRQLLKGSPIPRHTAAHTQNYVYICPWCVYVCICI